MADITNKVEYRVTQVTYARKMCTACGGTGFQDKERRRACTYCRNGVAIIEHQTSISLLDALHNLGLIKKQSENEKTANSQEKANGSDQ